MAKLKAKYGRVWLVGFIDSIILNCCFGNDNAANEYWGIIRDKLEAKEQLSGEERTVVKTHLYEVSRGGVLHGTVFSKVERDKAYHIASLLDRWA